MEVAIGGHGGRLCLPGGAASQGRSAAGTAFPVVRPASTLPRPAWASLGRAGYGLLGRVTTIGQARGARACRPARGHGGAALSGCGRGAVGRLAAAPCG